MSETAVIESPAAPDRPLAQRPDRAAPWLLLVLLALLALAALPERLQVGEAELLVRLLDQGAAAPSAPVERTWSFVVGTMERPSRLLGVLSAGLALILVFIAGRRLEGGGRSIALLGLAASGLFWRGALEIGGGGLFLAMGAGAVALCRSWRFSEAWAALSGGLAAGVLPFFLADEGARAGELRALAPRFPEELLAPNLVIGLGAAILVGLVLLAGRRGALIVAVLALATGPSLVGARAELETGSLVPAMLAMLPALGLACGFAFSGRETKRAPFAVLLVGLVLAGAAAAARERLPEAGNDRARLDLAADLLPESGWLAICGERGPVLRYYERVGHRSAARSFLIRGPDEEQALVDGALIEQPPVILLVDADDKTIAALTGRYQRLELAQPTPGLALFAFHRR